MRKYDRIKYSYVFSAEEQALIDEKYKKSKDWNKKCFDGIKSNIREYLRYLQGNTCCYCKRMLGFDKRCVEIEHIISRNENKAFGFVPNNLALACSACNSCKSSAKVLKVPKSNIYPVDPNSFLIVHPYYDDYSKHIRLINNCIYISKTEKGTNTIRICKLDRLTVIEQHIKSFFYKQKLIDSLLALKCTNDNKAAIGRAINEIVFM